MRFRGRLATEPSFANNMCVRNVCQHRLAIIIKPAFVAQRLPELAQHRGHVS